MNRNTWYLSFTFTHFKLNSICLYDADASIFVAPFSRHQILARPVGHISPLLFEIPTKDYNVWLCKKNIHCEKEMYMQKNIHHEKEMYMQKIYIMKKKCICKWRLGAVFLFFFAPDHFRFWCHLKLMAPILYTWYAWIQLV
jgi:hypothetical protein